MAKANKPKHKIWYEFNFYIALASIVGVFFAEDINMVFIMLVSAIANLGAAQGLCNKHNIECLYKENINE